MLNVDLLHTQTGTVLQGAIAAGILRKPHVWSIHEYGDLDHGLGFPKSKKFFALVVKSLSKQTIVNSFSVSRHIFNNFNNVSIIYPTPKSHQAHQNHASKNNSWKIGLVGTQNEGKGHIDFIRAIAHLNSQGLKVEGHFFGSRSLPNSNYLLQQIELLGLQSQILIHENVSRQDEIYADLGVVVICSRMEAFGRVPFEAAARRIPVIYPYAGGIPEYMENNLTGIGYQPGDHSSLALQIKRFMLDQDLYAKISILGSARLLEKMNNWDSTSKTRLTFEKAVNGANGKKTFLEKLMYYKIQYITTREYKRKLSE
jgi:glycosyltransferase involved in cell wall biosynthesis